MEYLTLVNIITAAIVLVMLFCLKQAFFGDIGSNKAGYMWSLILSALIVVMAPVTFVVLCLYINRRVERVVEPIARKVEELRQELETLQQLYNGLQHRYIVLREWALGLAQILVALGQDYPAPPSEILNE